MAKKKASRPAQPASPSQKRKGNGNGNGGKQAPIAPSGLKAFVPPAESQSSHILAAPEQNLQLAELHD